jgi:hypothetical protein
MIRQSHSGYPDGPAGHHGIIGHSRRRGMIHSIKNILVIYIDTFRKIGLWLGWFLYNLDRVNDRIFDLVISHEPYKNWKFKLANFYRTRGTNDSSIFISAAAEAEYRLEAMGEVKKELSEGLVIVRHGKKHWVETPEDIENQLLYRCLYGLRLYKCIFDSYMKKMAGSPDRGEDPERQAYVPILTDEEIRQLLEAIDERQEDERK